MTHGSVYVNAVCVARVTARRLAARCHLPAPPPRRARERRRGRGELRGAVLRRGTRAAPPHRAPERRARRPYSRCSDACVCQRPDIRYLRRRAYLGTPRRSLRSAAALGVAPPATWQCKFGRPFACTSSMCARLTAHESLTLRCACVRVGGVLRACSYPWLLITL